MGYYCKEIFAKFLVLCNEEKLYTMHIYVQIAKPRGDYLLMIHNYIKPSIT